MQTTIFAHLTLLGQSLQIVTLAAIAWGLLRNLEEGVVWGFIAGISLDFFSIGPTGAHAFSIMLAVGLIALLELGLPPGRFLLPPLFGGIGASAALLIYAALLQVSGYTADWSLINELVLFAIAQATMMVPVYWALLGLSRILYPPQVESTS